MKAKLTYIVLALVLVSSLIAVIIPTSPVSALTTWYVDDDNCPGPGTGTLVDPFCSIQSAIGNAGADDTIIVAPGTYNEHDITINKSLSIQGAGAGSTFIDGQDISRVISVLKQNGCIVHISGMTIRNGNNVGDGSGIFIDGCILTMTDCIISDNVAIDNGGGIYNHIGNVTLINCTISNNAAYNDNGGGIYNDSTLTLINCTVSGNWNSDDYGGGIYSSGTLTMTDCTVSGNNATKDGGGIYIVYGNLIITNCTVSGNTAGNGGGGIYIYEYNTLTIINCTITQNECTNDGGGVLNNYASFPIRCTIVYGNTAGGSGDDIHGNKAATECIIGDPDGDPDPLLGPLQDNGGPTETHALITGSPAIDACITSCIVYADQRWQPRPVDGDNDGVANCDVGAYEKQPAVVVVGGIVEPVDRIGILAPWLAMAALTAVAVSVVVAMRRRHLA